MINILVVSHCGLTVELIKTAEVIAGKQENLYFVQKNIDDENLFSLQEKVVDMLKKINTDKGTLILTDMLGGTPCNASLPACKDFTVEILTGVNLPMLLSAIFASRISPTVKDLANKVLEDGKKSMINAKELFMARLK